jgi:hypothetical protein
MNMLEKVLFKSKVLIDLPLACRGIGVVCIVQIILLFPNYYEIYGANGLSRSTLNFLFTSPYDLTVDGLAHFLSISDFAIVNILVALWAVLSVLLVKQGKNLLITALLWLVHLVLVNSSFLFSYGADYMITFGLSFLLGTTLLVEVKHFFSLPITQAEILSFATRTLQLFLCVVYFFGGLGKVIGFDWLNGNAMWKVMVYFQYDIVRKVYPLIPTLFWSITGWVFMFTELFYPILVYNRYTSKYALAIMVTMHICIALFLNLYVFAAIMIFFNGIGFHFLVTNTNDSDKRVKVLEQPA